MHVYDSFDKNCHYTVINTSHAGLDNKRFEPLADRASNFKNSLAQLTYVLDLAFRKAI